MTLLDTHAALWAVESRLPGNVAKRIDAASARSELLLSPVSAWEIGMLVSKGRLKLSESAEAFIARLFSQPGVVIANLTPRVALQSATLGMHADPADRMLVATAIGYGADFVTRDARIVSWAKSTRALRCVAC